MEQRLPDVHQTPPPLWSAQLSESRRVEEIHPESGEVRQTHAVLPAPRGPGQGESGVLQQRGQGVGEEPVHQPAAFHFCHREEHSRHLWDQEHHEGNEASDPCLRSVGESVRAGPLRRKP